MAYDLDKSMGQLKVHHRKSDFLPSPGLLFDSKPNSWSPQLHAPKNTSHNKSTVGLLRLYHTLRSKLHKFLSGVSLQAWKFKQMGRQEWCRRTRVQLAAISEKLIRAATHTYLYSITLT